MDAKPVTRGPAQLKIWRFIINKSYFFKPDKEILNLLLLEIDKEVSYFYGTFEFHADMESWLQDFNFDSWS